MAKIFAFGWNKRVWALLCAVALAGAAAWGQEVPPSVDYMPPEHAAKVAELMPTARSLAGGIRFVETRAGEGPLIESGDTVEAIYTGKLLDGTVFNRKTGQFHTFTFTVGAKPRQIIRGWEIAMPLMREGGRYSVAIPSEFAYRDKGRPGQVPPYATVIFEIEILDLK